MKTSKPYNWSIHANGDCVHTLAAQGNHLRALLISDAHFDSTKCNRKLLKKHLDEAAAINAPVFHFGDWFDMMQGAGDKRGNKTALRAELKREDYFTAVVQESAQFLSQYDNLALWTLGNHETSVIRNHEFNPLAMLKAEMAARGKDLYTGEYWGFVRIKQYRNKTTFDTTDLHYFHGAAGGGHVSGGMPENSKIRSSYDADIYYAGHQHNRSMDDRIITRLTTYSNEIERCRQISLRGSTYKDEAVGKGWFIEKGMVARPQGGWWIDLELHREDNKMRTTVIPTPA